MEKKSNSFFNEMAKPFIVLVLICVVVAALLAYTNSVTEPIIDEMILKKAEETRKAVLEGASSFSQIDITDMELGSVTDVYREDSGLGYVITAANKGYGGNVVVTVGLDGNGAIVGINADVSTETSGVGSKAGAETYLSKYMGAQGEAAVDTISTATYSSLAVKNGVNDILKAFETVKEAK